MAAPKGMLLIPGEMNLHLFVLPRHTRRNIPEDDMMSLRRDPLAHETIELVKEDLLKDCEMHLLSSQHLLLLDLLI
jgi:hypothetical protein